MAVTGETINTGPKTKEQGPKDRGGGRNSVALTCTFYDRTATCVDVLSSNVQPHSCES